MIQDAQALATMRDARYGATVCEFGVTCIRRSKDCTARAYVDECGSRATVLHCDALEREHAAAMARLEEALDGAETKVCAGCGRTLPATLEWFHRCGGTSDGLSRRCKECANKASRERVRKHRRSK